MKVSLRCDLAGLETKVCMKSLVQLWMHELCLMGEGDPLSCLYCVLGLTAEDFCWLLPALRPVHPFPELLVACIITWSHCHPLKLHVGFFWNNSDFQTSSIRDKFCKFMWASAQFLCGWVQGITREVYSVSYCLLFPAKCQLLSADHWHLD